MSDPGITRKEMLTTLITAAVGATVSAAAAQETTKQPMPIQEQAVENTASEQAAQTTAETNGITVETLKSAEQIAGLDFSEAQRQAILKEVGSLPQTFERLRQTPIPYTIEPPTRFTPLGSVSLPKSRVRAVPTSSGRLNRKKLSDEQIAFLSLRELAALVRSREISPVELTRLYLDRLKRYGDKLLCVITLTEGLALSQAARAEKEIAAGHYRGPLHGIPYGIKDLFAVKGIPTTWGAAPYAHQVFDYDATIVTKLEQAGAILVAKLSMGALAMDDIWFRGKTRNPWNVEQGSSGSSAGSASATAAGLVGFSIGTETLGSITSPSHRCRVSGLRPTYGRVSRHGAMGLSYTMDKIGPICREIEDCALVFAAICGADPEDPVAVDQPFHWLPRVDFSKLRIGLLAAPNADLTKPQEMEQQPAILHLKAKGATIRPVKFTPAPGFLISVLEVEAASAFDALTRSPDLDSVENSEWPNSFRTSRYIPAVEYLQAQRVRSQVMRRFEEEFGDLDMFIAQGTGGYTLSLTNYTGHPQAIIPLGQSEKGENYSLSFIGRIHQEDRLLAVAQEVQKATPFHHLHPDMSKV